MTEARNQHAGALAKSRGHRDSGRSQRAGRGRRIGAFNAGVAASLMALGAFGLAAPAAAQDAIKGDAQKARDKVAMCSGCHGIKGYRASYPEVYHVPMIGGQSERYIAAALEAYRKGDRSNPTMRAIAGGLTDQDIADLAAYYSHGGLTALGSAK